MKFLTQLRFRRAAFSIAAVTILMAAFSVQCKSPTSPEGKGEADILVTNDYGKTVAVYMDEVFMFKLPNKTTIEIDNVSIEDHDMLALDPETGKTVDEETLEVTEKIDYTWTVDDPPDIKVANKYGKALKIYMDGEFQFNLADEEERWIVDVPFGERFLKAVLASDGSEVASTTIKVKEYTDYTWDVQKIKAN